MKRIAVSLMMLVFTHSGFCQSESPVAIIPQPVSLEKTGAGFHLNEAYIRLFKEDKDLSAIAEQFNNRIKKAMGVALEINIVEEKRAAKIPAVTFSIIKGGNTKLGKEGYTLKSSTAGVVIEANEPAGIYYGMQTLLQLLPKQIEAKSLASATTWEVPGVLITDYPRFGWRGLMFDVSRHFFTKGEVMDFIDQMSKYKYNLLHLHLTDDQGWRIEIKSLPKLTEVGAWRVDKTGTFGTFSEPAADEPKTYGGFFTQADMKEIITYAQARYVNILPEIDVPGHSMAALAAYPDLSTTPGQPYTVNAGNRFMIWPPSGHFYGTIDNALNPANEKVYELLDKVFTEVAALFPFEYIHMGGDETARNFWEKSDDIKALMKRENLKDLNEVQSYFVKRVEKIISSKGKKMIGWDEILEGGLAPNAAVMSWRGMKGGTEAAKAGHEVVMSPSTFAYLDYMQGDAAIEPPVYATLRLRTTYQFEPVPEGVDPKFIKGGQANIWTEQIYNTRHLQYMVWPRGFAIAESLWSPKEQRNWDDFVKRTEVHFQRLNMAGVKYAPSLYDPIVTAKKDSNGKLAIDLSTEIEGLDIYYSFDNSSPDNFYPRYTTTLVPPKDAVKLRVITYRGGQVIGRELTILIKDLQTRAGIK
ncbi:MAG: beta-N-acetylhexosaminidase [Chitinophagaceae bacterium]